MNGQQVSRPIPPHSVSLRYWQGWAPYAAVVWSLSYAALGLYWATSGRGFPYVPGLISDETPGLMAGRFGPSVAWIIVVAAGSPAAILGVAMLRGVRSRVLRPLFVTAGFLLAVVLVLFTAQFMLLIQRYTVFGWTRAHSATSSTVNKLRAFQVTGGGCVDCVVIF